MSPTPLTMPRSAMSVIALCAQCVAGTSSKATEAARAAGEIRFKAKATLTAPLVNLFIEALLEVFLISDFQRTLHIPLRVQHILDLTSVLFQKFTHNILLNTLANSSGYSFFSRKTTLLRLSDTVYKVAIIPQPCTILENL